MKRFIASWIYLFLICLQCNGTPDSSIRNSDRVIFFYEILHRVEQPLTHELWIEKGESLFIDKAYYTEWTEAMERFYQASQQGKLLPKNAFFGTMVLSHHKQMLGLYHFLKNPPAWEYFVQNACWARQHVNPHMFVYAFTMAVLARSSYNGAHLPLIYEIIPRHFIDHDFVASVEEFNPETWTNITNTEQQTLTETQNIESWHWWKILGLNDSEWYGVDDVIVKKNLPMAFFEDPLMKSFWRAADYTRNLVQHHNKESALSYLTEDSNWNAYWYNVNQLYAFPIEGNNLLRWNERLGEYWFHFLQQYLTRYSMERLSHGLGTIPAFDWETALKDGYDPELRSMNGLKFSFRPNNWAPTRNSQSSDLFKEIYDSLVYFKSTIDAGKLMLRNGTVVDLRNPKSAFHIYDLIRGHRDPNGKYIKSNWYSLALMYFADASPVSPGKVNKHVRPHVLLNFETMPRDPFFYVFHQEIVKLKQSFESHLPPYDKNELHMEGVQIIGLSVTELVTYDDIFDYDVTNLLRTNLTYKAGQFQWKENMLARRARLNHKPFDLHIKINSEKNRNVLIRFYLGPKFDEFGRTLSLAENQNNFLHLTTVARSLKSGENNLTFNYESNFVRHNKFDKSTFFQVKLYHVALDFNTRGYINVFAEGSKHCGLHDHLLIPRGHAEGLHMQLFAHVIDRDDQLDLLWWRPCEYRVVNKSLGFPFDRPIPNEEEFLGSTMLLQDVKIYHKDKFQQLKDYFRNSGKFPYEEFDNYGVAEED